LERSGRNSILGVVSTVDLEPIRGYLAPDAAADTPFSLFEAAERAAGLGLLVVTSPIIATSALWLVVQSRSSPFVAHLRVGKNGVPFWMWKLRTMWTGDPSRFRRRWVERIVADPSDDGKDRFDPRVGSRFASFCRRHSIDELPQLWHVYRGKMSLVGPRPLTRSEVLQYYRMDASELLSVKPGLTGLWQVFGRSAIKFPRRADMDLCLVRTLTPKLYIKILLRTIPAIIRGTGAW